MPSKKIFLKRYYVKTAGDRPSLVAVSRVLHLAFILFFFLSFFLTFFFERERVEQVCGRGQTTSSRVSFEVKTTCTTIKDH